MIEFLLNFLPVSIVQKLGDSSFANLRDRGGIKTWMVAFHKDSILIQSEDEENWILDEYEDENEND